jgi:hemolysin activation/secretion protein
MRKNTLLKTITLSVATSSLLLSATPNIDSIEKSIVVPQEVEILQNEKKEPLVEIGGKKQLSPAMSDDKSGKAILVSAFSFEGNTQLSNDELQLVLGEYLNKELTFSQMQEATSLITKYYRNKGFFVARAYIPVQDIKANNNILKISIIEGNYGKFKLTNHSYVKDSIVQGLFDDAKNRGNIVSTDTLERSMLIINDTPGAKVTKADVRPGEAVGTSDFEVEADKSALYDGYIIGDNYGSLYTGKNRLMGGINLNSPAGIGDKLSLSGLLSNGSDLQNYRVGYSAPLMPNGLRGELSYSNTEYNLVKLGGTTPDDAYDGKSSTIEATLSYPIIRSRVETLNFNFGYALKDMSDYFNDAIQKDRDIKVATFGINRSKSQTFFGLDAKTTTEGIFTIGKLTIVDDTSNTADSAGADTQGNYSKVNFNASANVMIDPLHSLSGNLKTQYALHHKNLDGSEDMSIGGANGVKVFADGELSGENGILFNLQLTRNLEPMSALSHRIGLFYDIGNVDMSDSSKDTTFKQTTLQDVGIGYYANYGSFFGKAELARVVGGQKITTENEGDISRVLFQAGWVF